MTYYKELSLEKIGFKYYPEEKVMYVETKEQTFRLDSRDLLFLKDLLK